MRRQGGPTRGRAQRTHIAAGRDENLKLLGILVARWYYHDCKNKALILHELYTNTWQKKDKISTRVRQCAHFLYTHAKKRDNAFSKQMPSVDVIGKSPLAFISHEGTLRVVDSLLLTEKDEDGKRHLMRHAAIRN